MFLDLAAVTTATTAAGSGWATAVVDLIVKGGALGLALMLTWMSYQLFKTLLAQPTVSRQKVMLVVFFVFGTFGSLVGGALMHRWLTNPRVEVTMLVSPELDRADDLPQIQATTVVPGPDPRKFRLAVAAGETLSAAVPFYGPAPASPDFSGSPDAAVLGVYAGNDSRVNGTMEAARSALEAAGLTHELRTFPGVDHAFFNDTGSRYAPQAAADAYAAVLDWFATHLA